MQYFDLITRSPCDCDYLLDVVYNCFFVKKWPIPQHMTRQIYSTRLAPQFHHVLQSLRIWR